MTKILVCFYSTYGHLFRMAQAAAEGAAAAGAEVVVKRVPETLPVEVLTKMGAVEAQKQYGHIPIVTVEELPQYDGFVFAAPTRFGSLPAQMQAFLDQTGQHWFQGALIGKVGSAMTSTGTQHGGNEATLFNFHRFFLHHGLVVVGLPGSFQGAFGVDAVKGGSPYGATTIAGAQGERMPSAVELEAAKFQGKHVATIAAALARR